MKIINCWEILVWDGGDRHNHKYYVATEEAAKQWKAEHTYDHIQSREFVILDDLGELADYEQMTLRKSGLAKLSPAERKALGLE